MPKLIASLTSPFARKVRIVAAEKRIECELVIDAPSAPDTQVAEFNPLGKVPVWVMDDGHSLFDSRVICEHLDSISPVHPLIPRENRPRIAVKRWEALADGISDAAALIVMERKRPSAQQSPEWITRQHGKITRALSAMAADLGPRDWCVENTYTLADIAVGCALGYLDLRFKDEIDWRRIQPHLSELYDRLMQRPSFKDSVPII
jgi:glutathione S-transferase